MRVLEANDPDSRTLYLIKKSGSIKKTWTQMSTTTRYSLKPNPWELVLRLNIIKQERLVDVQRDLLIRRGRDLKM